MSFEPYLFFGLAAAVAVVFWVLAHSGDPSRPDVAAKPPRPPTRRDELIQARKQIRRQIEILGSPMRGRDYTADCRQTQDRLEEMLREIEDELGGARTGGVGRVHHIADKS